MHMADGFVSPAVGCTMWAATAAITVLCARRIKQEKEARLVPLMGVLGAFIFACQMLNFTIPGTGSSGHLGGGLILAILLGPYAGFLVMAAILAVQALFFADGGLLGGLAQIDEAARQGVAVGRILAVHQHEPALTIMDHDVHGRLGIQIFFNDRAAFRTGQFSLHHQSLE